MLNLIRFSIMVQAT